MKRFFRIHYQGALVVATILIISVLVFYSLWAIKVGVQNLNRALSRNLNEGVKINFDIEGAKKLDLRLPGE
ncbi:MAG: hypothetical protein HYT13_02175 [Candidatus Liptonbacteria bacterium]|nr:hypothetical protein [Candidatus Liptonbacteria bacterium]